MSKMNKKIAIVIAVSLTLLIIAGGITAYFLTRDKGVAAVVNGVTISDTKIEEEMSKTVAQYTAQGMELQPEQLVEVRSSIVDDLITREVLLQESASYEITVEDLSGQISTFRNQFNTEEEFVEALSTQGFNLESFTKVITEDLKIQKLIEEKVPEKNTVTEDEIVVFYNENPTYFTSPERVHASHILVSLENKTTDQEKEQAMAKIKRIENELKNGADFGELAKEESEGPSGPNGGDLGEFTKGQMVPSFEEIAFSLPPEKTSGIVETQFGYHIIKVHEKFPESSIPLEEVKESITSYLEQQQGQDKINTFIDSLKTSAKIRIPNTKSAE